MTILAWHNNPNLKTEATARLRAHRAEDSIVKGLYQLLDPDLASGYRGCAIGCTLPPQAPFDPGGTDKPGPPEGGWHGEVERLYGIPRPIARLIDGLFENLPTDGDQHAEFAVAVIDAVPVGADLSLVISRFLLDVLADPECGARQYTVEDSRQREAVDAVVSLYRRKLAGEEISRQEWAAAAVDAAYAAADAAYAADAAAAYADAAAAYAAADAAYAADAAAYAAAYAADAADARNGMRVWQAERLIHHLTTAPIGTPQAVTA
jgi:hypothetical protein